MLHITFGLALDQSHYPLPQTTEIHHYYLGPNGLLKTLENLIGESGHRLDNEYLRIEQYRQVVLDHLQDYPEAFFATAFAADQFACAQDLLDRRDELLMAGFNFNENANTPERFRQFCLLEKRIKTSKTFPLFPGIADRWETLITLIPTRKLAIQQINLLEPPNLLPPIHQRLLLILAEKGVNIQQIKTPEYSGNTDLRSFQELLQMENNEKMRLPLRGDGSLLWIKAKRDTDLAAFLAGVIRKTPNYHPLLLLSGPAQVLDNALIHEGQPSIGVKTTSLSRPALQLLKLATVFLWAPLDPYKVLEFVSLNIQPIESDLAYQIAAQIARVPGVKSESWKAMIAQYFRDLEQKEVDAAQIDEIRHNYRFWFEREQYPAGGLAPKIEAIHLFDFLQIWARKKADEVKKEASTLFLLAEKARQVKELLEELPEQEMSRLDLERVVRAIYEPATLQLNDPQLKALPIVEQSHAIFAPVDQCIWWNFMEQEPNYFFSRWSKQELKHLKQQGIKLDGPKEKNSRLIWHRKRSILWTSSQMILVSPQIVEGKEMLSHPLSDEMEASLEKLDKISFSIDHPEQRKQLEQFLSLPKAIQLEGRKLGQPKAFLKTKKALNFQQRQHETITSLELLFYYPYQWMFKYLLRLRKSPILSIVEEPTLQGNLAHRLLELLLKQEDVLDWSKTKLDHWMQEQAQQLFLREGAVLLLYGKEPLRISFTKKMQYAAWSLLDLLKNNQWQVWSIEKELEGVFHQQAIKGRADLLLKRGEEYAIIDLKWRGAYRRRQMLKNMEDLQLVLYSYLLQPNKSWPHTAYFIIEKGEMIARNNEAFSEIIPVTPDLALHPTFNTIFDRMQATYQWRMSQLKSGEIEVRCEQTLHDLEDRYDDLLHLLEMKSRDAPYDDYRTLINLTD